MTQYKITLCKFRLLVTTILLTGIYILESGPDDTLTLSTRSKIPFPKIPFLVPLENSSERHPYQGSKAGPL